MKNMACKLYNRYNFEAIFYSCGNSILIKIGNKKTNENISSDFSQ